MLIEREKLLNNLIEPLIKLEFVNAAWEIGAIAFNRIDKYSDIDLMIDCNDDKIEELFLIIEDKLNEIDSIEFDYRMPFPSNAEYQQKFYKLKNYSKYFTLDLAILKNSAKEKFLEREIHGNIKILFDKIDITKVKALNKLEFAEKIDNTINDLKKRMLMFHQIVEKEFYRNNPCEAIYGYNSLILNSLITLIRIYFNPFHFNFRQRYLHYELDKKTIKKLQNLFFVKDTTDLKKKYKIAMEWFKELTSNLNKQRILEILDIN